MSSLLRKLPKPALIFALALPLLWLRFGHWFFLSLDEGIYLEGASRVASGQVPYRDFFAITGPGTFWLYGTVFHFVGTSFAAARAVLCLELAATCGAIYYLVCRTTSALFAAGTSLLFLAMLLTTLYPIYITHRWDSNTFALLALCCLPRRPLLAGILAGIAAWITPPLLFIALALGLWLALSPQPLRPYLAGLALPTVAALGILTVTGALGAFFQSILWDTSHYAPANRLPYGALSLAFQSFRPADLIHYVDSILPNLLPPLAAIAIVIFVLAKPAFSPRRFEALLAAAAFAALAACYPRLGAAQLLFAASFLWIVCATALNDILPTRARTATAVAAILLAIAAPLLSRPPDQLKPIDQLKSIDQLKPIDTPAGALQVSRRHFVTLNDLQAATRPGDRAFVYPYLPALYFALGLQNPTRYAWLQPGMMSPADVQSAISSLQATPPRWVIWHDFTEAYILKNWPSSDRNRLRFPEMEAYLLANYHIVTPDGVPTIGFKLMEKNP